MSLLDSRNTAAYTTFRVDRGPRVAPRYIWTPAQWLDNMSALGAQLRYPPGSADMFQWDAKRNNWIPLVRGY